MRKIHPFHQQRKAMTANTHTHKSFNPCKGLSPWVHHKWYQLTPIRGCWSTISIMLPCPIWSTISIMLLWSGVGGQLLKSSSHDTGKRVLLYNLCAIYTTCAQLTTKNWPQQHDDNKRTTWPQQHDANGWPPTLDHSNMMTIADHQPLTTATWW